MSSQTDSHLPIGETYKNQPPPSPPPSLNLLSNFAPSSHYETILKLSEYNSSLIPNENDLSVSSVPSENDFTVTTNYVTAESTQQTNRGVNLVSVSDSFSFSVTNNVVIQVFQKSQKSKVDFHCSNTGNKGISFFFFFCY